ncbi:FkbM family methyltransferase [Thermodesulfobacteriota bacterium]
MIEVPRRLLHEFKEIFMEECYTTGLPLEVPERPTILDIGANAGFFSLFAASRFPKASIFAYEPIPVNFRQLERNIDLNKHARIASFQKAVFGFTGEISLCFDPNDLYTTSASVLSTSGPQTETLRVSCMTLQDILDKHNIERCDLLKIDCEGSEYEILYNCSRNYLQRIRQTVIEVHKGNEPDQNIESLMDYFSAQNFKTHRSEHILWAWRK